MPVIELYQPISFDGVQKLWEDTFPNDPPWNQAHVVIPDKMAAQPELFLIARDGDQLVGAGLGGYDGHRGWIYSVAVRQSYCRRGIGSMLVRALEARVSSMGCAKVNLQVLGLNVGLLNFYHSLGYEVEERISMGRRLAKDSGHRG